MKLFKILILTLFTCPAVAQLSDIYSLEQCMTLAIQNAPELKSTSAVIDQALAAKAKAHTSVFAESWAVQAQANIVYRRHLEFDESYFIDRDLQIPVWFGWQTDSRFGLTYTMPFSAGRYKKQDKKMATAFVEQKEADHQVQILAIKNEVIRLYNLYQQMSRDLTTNLDLFNSQKVYYQTTKQQYQNGQITELEFGPVELAYNQAELQRSAADANLKTAYQWLVVRVGQEIRIDK